MNFRYDPAIEPVVKQYAELRYQLLPYTYSLLHQASQTGAPLMRPLVWHYPSDPATFDGRVSPRRRPRS